MKFGLRYCNTDKYAVDTALAVELVQAGEAAGFESAWTVEHTVTPSGYQSVYPYSETGKIAGGAEDLILPDPLIWMAHMAGATSKIKFGTAILILPQHSPVVCAAQVATLDYMSGGRVLLGIGVGWLGEEFKAIGAPFERRGPRTDEYVAAMRELWANDCATFDGEFVQFTDTYCLPRPVRGSVPIIVGGDTDYAARRAGRRTGRPGRRRPCGSRAPTPAPSSGRGAATAPPGADPRRRRQQASPGAGRAARGTPGRG